MADTDEAEEASVVVGGGAAVVSNLKYDLEYDENQRLNGNYLVYEKSPACQSQQAKLDTFTHSRYVALQAVDAAHEALFGSNNNNDKTQDTTCRAVCLGRGVSQDLVHAVMPHMRYDHDDDKNRQSAAQGLDVWFKDSCSQVESCFMNYYDPHEAIQIYWIHPTTGQRVKHVTLEYGEQKTKCFSTYLGHEFVAESASGQEIGRVVIEFVTVLAFGDSPPSGDPKRHGDAIQAEITSTLQHEWTRHERVTRTFSPLGFAKGRLPDDVFAYVGAFYYNNRRNRVREEWKGKGVFVNWWETEGEDASVQCTK